MNSETQNELLIRGIANIYPSKEYVEARILRGEKLTIYLGIDPTGPTLHLGNAIPLKKLADFQKAGHKVILLIGDFTAMIGDPDKLSARVPLTRKQVLSNLKNYKKQASKLLSFSGKNKAEIKFNSKWLSKMRFEDVLSLASQMTVSQMLERDMFKRRIEEQKPIFIHEFMYPLMQGYDSVAMDVDGEIGGNDQTFNMLCGRNLLKTLKNKEKFVLTMKLLEDNNGKKMGKTEGNMVALSDTPEDMYGKVMSWADSLIVPALELSTTVSLLEIETMRVSLEDGTLHPRDAKMRLAREIVSLFYDTKKAQSAEDSFIQTFKNNATPEDILTVSVKGQALLVDILISHAIVSSKSEFARLVEGGAVTNLDTQEKVSDPKIKSIPGCYRVGKARFIKII
ncbi:MAG: tyrosine--tRNA ligase [Candidatus Pacebacteria bacterium]|jgi:tyrosyl-tRNA synthetase|nr:tyrosine--tRNA ligase [Candidatus Paceibacterota bacterium]